MNALRQSTASQAIKLGPFMDAAGDVQTGLTIANTDIKISKAGGASANKNSGGATHDVNAKYTATLDATDTNTVGIISISVLVAPALVVNWDGYVFEEAVFDALFASNATGYSTLTAVQVWAEATRTITGMGTDAISAAALSAAAANKQADHTIKRHSATARASSDGDTPIFRSLLGAMSKQHNRFNAAGNPVNIYEENDTTVFGQQTKTTNAAAEPIEELNTV